MGKFSFESQRLKSQLPSEMFFAHYRVGAFGRSGISDAVCVAAVVVSLGRRCVYRWCMDLLEDILSSQPHSRIYETLSGFGNTTGDVDFRECECRYPRPDVHKQTAQDIHVPRVLCYTLSGGSELLKR